jgi:hypothetical protein
MEMGMETVAGSVIIGKGKERKEFRSGPDGVVLDLESLPSEQALVLGAQIAEKLAKEVDPENAGAPGVTGDPKPPAGGGKKPANSAAATK